jgi:soluble lytic murein transglycosylase-like protein
MENMTKVSWFLGLLIFLTGHSSADTITTQRGRDGRWYFTNRVTTASHMRPASPAVPPPRRQHARVLPLVYTLAQQYDIDAQLVRAIITVESNFNAGAISRAGAQGLMQLMPATAARYGVSDPFEPKANIEGGIRFLKDLWRDFQGDVRRVLAAYNAGVSAVQQYGGIPPYPETQHYVARVLALYNTYSISSRIYRYRTLAGTLLFTDTPR